MGTGKSVSEQKTSRLSKLKAWLAFPFIMEPDRQHFAITFSLVVIAILLFSWLHSR